MGYPGKNHKQYETPKRRFEKTRIEEEKRLLIDYGLRNKRELWKAQSVLRKYRQAARDILALESGSANQELVERKRSELLGRLNRIGLLGADGGIEDVLALRVEQQVERRLQTIVYRRGLARSPKQARQLITHGHIALGGRKVTVPGYLVTRSEEENVSYYSRSPLTNDLHPEKGRITGGK